MTRDHSLVNDYLLAMPELTEEQRNELPKNVITRALGMQDQVAVDLQSDEVKPGDLFILCSDGLTGMIDDAELLEIIRTTQDLEEACRRLVAVANEHGGEDNITAVVVRIEGESTDSDQISLSDTLRDAPEAELVAKAVAEAEAQRQAATADTPPAGLAVPRPEPAKKD